MSRGNDQPFSRGETYYNGGTIPNFASPPNGIAITPGGFNLEGKEYEFEDGSSAADEMNTPGYGTGMYVKVRAVRNASGFNIKPGQICTFTTTYVDGSTVVPYGICVGGVTDTLAAFGYPADEFLPAAGVPNGDLFYIVVEGPCLLKLAVSGDVVLVPGQKVVSATGSAASNSSDPNAGTVIGQSIIDTTADPTNVLNANQIQNAIGRAMSQASSEATGTETLVDIGWD